MPLKMILNRIKEGKYDNLNEGYMCMLCDDKFDYLPSRYLCPSCKRYAIMTTQEHLDKMIKMLEEHIDSHNSVKESLTGIGIRRIGDKYCYVPHTKRL